MTGVALMMKDAKALVQMHVEIAGPMVQNHVMMEDLDANLIAQVVNQIGPVPRQAISLHAILQAVGPEQILMLNAMTAIIRVVMAVVIVKLKLDGLALL